MSDFEAVVSAITVRHRGASINSENCTNISLASEGDEAFVEIDQSSDVESVGVIRVYPDEWPVLRRAIARMIRLAQKEPE